MGNFCDHHLDPKLIQEAEVPIKELFDGCVLEDSPENSPGPAQVVARAISINSCLQTQKQHTLEIAIADEDYRSMPDCLLPPGDDSGEEDEIDFSKDLELHDKRTPAVFVGRDAKTGEARYSMPSPSRRHESPAPESLRNVELARLSGPGPLPSTSNSFYVRRGTPATPQSVTSQRAQSQLQRSHSSYILATAAVRVTALPRSDSSYIPTRTLPRSDSSYFYTPKAVRCKSAPAGPSPEQVTVATTGPLVEELQLSSAGWPDPSIQPLREKVFALLGVSDLARIESMQGFIGGQNQGMWVLQDGMRTLILKLVEAKRKHHAVATEAEQFLKLAKQHPAMRSDPALAFPIKVLRCRDANGSRHHDLIVMHKAQGESLAETIAQKVNKRQVPQLMQMFEALGRFLAGIHNRYNMEHGDLQPSNIFYDESSGSFTLIDVGGMDTMPYMLDSDVEHFGEALRMLARGLKAHELFQDACRQFKAGYAAAQGI